jgi:hypothetical protein
MKQYIPSIIIACLVSCHTVGSYSSASFLAPPGGLVNIAGTKTEYYARLLLEDPLQSVWNPDCSRLGTLNEKGQRITFNPEVALKIASITKRLPPYQPVLRRIFKEAARKNTDIDVNSEEWQFLLRISTLASAEDLRTANDKFINFTDDMRRSILSVLEKYQHAALPLFYDSELYLRLTVDKWDDLFLYYFFGKGYGWFFDSVSSRCGTMMDEIKNTLIRLHHELTSTGCAASAYAKLIKGEIEPAIKSYTAAIQESPASASRIADILSSLAVRDPQHAHACNTVAYRLREQGVWTAYIKFIPAHISSVTAPHQPSPIAVTESNIAALIAQ